MSGRRGGRRYFRVFITDAAGRREGLTKVRSLEEAHRVGSKWCPTGGSYEIREMRR